MPVNKQRPTQTQNLSFLRELVMSLFVQYNLRRITRIPPLQFDLFGLQETDSKKTMRVVDSPESVTVILVFELLFKLFLEGIVAAVLAELIFE